MEHGIFGPSLPPSQEDLSKAESNSRECSKLYGPQLPPDPCAKLKKDISPQLSTTETHPLDNEDSSSKKSDSKEHINLVSDYYGPQLLPHLLVKLNKNTSESPSTAESEQDDAESADDEEEVYGPVLPGSLTTSKVQEALEERALKIKLGHTDLQKEKKNREEWMLELPEVGKSLGLGARSFRKTEGPDFSDRSQWTETPGSKNKRSKHSDTNNFLKEVELKESRKRDKEQEKIAEKHNKKKKRDKSLYEIHQENMKKKKKEEGNLPARTPFSRERDLNVNRFDEAQKKAIMKKAQHLNDRFSEGQAKYL